MAMNNERPEELLVDSEATAAYAHLFDALSDPTRLRVLQHLATGEHRVRDLVEHVGLAQSTVSKHLSFLLACRLVSVRPDGRSSWYALAEPGATAGLVGAAEALLRATGTDATLCPHIRELDPRDEVERTEVA
ncbi:ArsR/SmtB family transcription factor [Microbacterium suaedae]|uniref:ArsR/SmtB family transcription factor n=1 Tax=Microbacterium suaedae TaxID=2067813 RepID=UPI000DA18AC0|nr:metalloregulator ArsR/SmtB family transcription factor [Microbacterium suaedae]